MSGQGRRGPARHRGAVTPLLGAVALSVAWLPGCGADDDPAAPGPIDECDWPMWGHGPDRTFSYPCDTAISPGTANDLEEAWFFSAEDAVTATPAVVDDTVYVGDWSGNFYALDLDTGKPRWTFEAEVHPRVYAGQIVSSAAVADVEGERVVFFGAGNALYALGAGDGALRWRHRLAPPGDDDDPREIESSPVVVDGTVIFGSDVHNADDGTPAAVIALDAATGDERWTTVTAPTEPGARTGDPADGRPTGSGCADVWGSPSVDPERRLVFVGTGNCTAAERWGSHSEAVLALDLDTGEVRWSYQPHEPNRDDLDFAGAPNLFAADGRAAVGLGNKDGAYYVVDRETGESLWSTRVAEPGIPEPGSDYSTGGFIGPSAVADGVIVGGTAVGGAPYLHAIDAESGDVLWQQDVAGPTYAAAAEANGVVFIGGTDFTFRALDLRGGDVLWERELSGAVSGGAVVVGDDVVAVAGIRAPGVDTTSDNSGVYRFSLGAGGGPATSEASRSPTTTAAPAGPPATNSRQALAQQCVAAACPLDFTISAERAGGDTARGTVRIQLEPFRVEVRAEGLGTPGRWLRPGSPAASDGATAFGVYLSQGTDNPVGGLVCVLDAADDCTGTENPAPGATYDRISILAVDDPGMLPSITEGIDRIVTTNGLEIPVTPGA
ncbi:MAG TPA: PQQ-binding-like beta-propeller repeat protein [Acidimicrobiales bacterium]|nr:PQQ-binding-like beta-propeller repeat protein [Acidimicrobiales bacterium]